MKILILLCFLFLFDVKADIGTKKIFIGKVFPIQSEKNTEPIDSVLIKHFTESFPDYEIRTIKNKKGWEFPSKIKNVYDFYLEIYYQTYPNYQPDIYALVYDPDTGNMIDAISETTNFQLLKNIELDKSEFTNEERIFSLYKKLEISISINPKKEVFSENIQEHFINSPLSALVESYTKDMTQTGGNVFELLEDEKVVTASRTAESLMDVPASTVVVTEQDIKNRGYTSLDDLFRDLPGFDYIGTQGWHHNTVYQRGYRTPFTSRTLLMIDGQIENDLWAQAATITRQYPLTNIKRVEVIYGPASAVYGPNAFQGIVNIITKDGSENEGKSYSGKVSLLHGSGNSWSVDGGVTAKYGDFKLAMSAKIHEGDDYHKNISNYGYNTIYWLSQPQVWGPMLYYGDGGKPFGKYSNPANNWGSILSLSFKSLKIGINVWDKYEGYGPYFAGDKAQPNAMWGKSSFNIYAENNWEINKKLSTYTLLSYRETRIYGNWAEALDDWDEGREMYSYISLTGWNSKNNSVLGNQNIEYKVNENLKMIAGLKIELKNLTKSYDVPGYWWGSTYSSVEYLNPLANPDIERQFPNGYSITHSTNPLYLRGPSPKAKMPEENMIGTTDRGGFLLSIIDIGKFRFSPGLRYDVNSIYGHSTNPRVTGIYKANPNNSIKLLYGEAFNEPPPIQLFGGWSGRTGDLNLKPEKVRTTELIYIHQKKKVLNEFSLYYSRYDNVIKESSENAGSRKIYGFEYKLRWNLENFIKDSAPINLYLYYTFTESLSSIYYDHNLGLWKEGVTFLGDYEYLWKAESKNLPRQNKLFRLGDIARDKLNLGINIPVKKWFIFNLRGNYVGRREFYLRNPLRNDAPIDMEDPEAIFRRIVKEQDRTLSPHFIFDTGITINYEGYGYFTLKVLNAFNQSYLHPGIESANSGNYYYGRSEGFHSSILPQPGRTFMINLTLTF